MSTLRGISLVVRFAVIGGGTMLLGGIALADSNVSVQSSDPNAVVNVQSHSTASEQTTSSQNAAVKGPQTSDVFAPDVKPPADGSKPLVSSLTSNPPQSTDPVVDKGAIVIPAPPIDVATVSLPAITSPVKATSVVPAIQSFIPKPRYYAITTAVTIESTQVAAEPVLVRTSQPSAPPVQPMGAIGAFLSFFATIMPTKNLDLFSATSSIFCLIMTLALVGLITLSRRYEISYGSWLKTVGYIAAGVSTLPAPAIIFIRSTAFGYACAPAPYA